MSVKILSHLSGGSGHLYGIYNRPKKLFGSSHLFFASFLPLSGLPSVLLE